MFCKYKDVFGKPGEGIHSTRWGPVAAFDTGATILVAMLLALVFHTSFFSFLVILLGLFVLGEFLHWIFCVDTPVILAIKRFFSKEKTK